MSSPSTSIKAKFCWVVQRHKKPRWIHQDSLSYYLVPIRCISVQVKWSNSRAVRKPSSLNALLYVWRPVWDKGRYHTESRPRLTWIHLFCVFVYFFSQMHWSQQSISLGHCSGQRPPFHFTLHLPSLPRSLHSLTSTTTPGFWHSFLCSPFHGPFQLCWDVKICV